MCLLVPVDDEMGLGRGLLHPHQTAARADADADADGSCLQKWAQRIAWLFSSGRVDPPKRSAGLAAEAGTTLL